MMKLGTIGAFGFEDFHPPEILALYAQAGCSLVQICRNRDNDPAPAEVLRVCNDLPMTVDSLHAHFGDDLDPSSEDENVRNATIDVYAREADYCRDIGGAMMVIHPSPANAPDGDLQRRHSQLRKSLEDFARLGERTGLVCAIENMPPYHPVGDDVGILCDAIEAVGSEHVGFLLDFGHAHMTCGIEEALRLSGSRMRFTHVHDNDGVNDSHQLPGRGTLPWDACRRALHDVGYDGVFMLEVFEAADDLRRLLSEEWLQRIQAILRNGR